MRVPRYVWISLVAIMLLIGAVALWAWAFEQALVGPRHEFPLTERPAFLTEELALTMAREALARDGFDPAEWQVRLDNRTSAPDGRRDQFLSRNTINPNQGSIVFEGPTNRRRDVSVELM